MAFPLTVLRAAREIRCYLDTVESEATQRAREAGASLADIAEALGKSRQAIHHRLRVERSFEGGGRVVSLPELEQSEEGFETAAD